MRRISLTLAGALSAAALGAAAAQAASVPDPLAAGPHPVEKVDYEAGDLLLTLPNGTDTTRIPLRGSVTWPADADNAPIVLFDHGRHTACLSDTPVTEVCDDEYDPDGTPVRTDVRSYAGYDYLAKNLASHGYAVMSVETNTQPFDNGWRDGGANARSQIVQANLELLYRWHKGAGPYVPGEPAHTIGTKLTGKLDFANPIGLMGHSRGGDAVTDFIGYTRNLRPRSSFPRMQLGAVLALAPVNYTRFKMPYGVNYGVLLPACDGDVSTLQGARFYENAKYPTAADTFAKVQWYVQGTNHNFYNTVWSGDDFSRAGDPACSRTEPSTARLTTRDQRRVGLALMNSFMRRYVGGERAFEPLMTGAVTLPGTGEPVESGKGAGQTVKTSYLAPSAARLDVLRPTPIADPQPDPADPSTGTPARADPTLTTTAATGGPITARGLDAFAVCNPNDRAWRQGPYFPVPYPECPDNAINRSIGNQFTVAWTGPATLSAGMGRHGAAQDVSDFGALHLRAATNRDDPRNPAGDGSTPQAATQDFDVTLVDAAGRRASTSAAAWSTALQPSIGTTYRHTTLNGIRIPLKAFAGVDLAQIARVELGFGTRTPMGSIQLADVTFQESPEPVDPVVPGPDGPPSTPPGPVIDPPRTTPVIDQPRTTPTAVCADTRKPVVRITQLVAKARKLWVGGVALDAGCADGRGTAAGGVQRTLVELFRPAGRGTARFVTSAGRLTKPLPLAQGVAISATGRGAWRVGVAKAKLPKGAYRVRVTTFDRSGNTTTLALRTLRLR